MASDVKWIKIATDIFDDEKIIIIEAQPDADAMIVIWFKILALAGRVNTSGVLMINDRIPYTDEMLATIFRRKLSQVKMALDLFSQLGMIEIINGVVTIPNWNKHQKLDLIENRREYQKEYMRERRDKQKQLALSHSCKPNSEPNGKPNVSILDNISSLSTSSLSLDLDLKEETLEELFEDFWSNYPKKVAKADAKKWFTKNKKTITRDFVDKIVLAIQKQKSSDEWKKDKGQYIPHASTWLNQERWNDVLTYSQQKIMTALERFMKDE